MLYLAFRRVKNHPNKESFQGLPDEYIVEVAPFDPNIHDGLQGWESLLEDKAKEEINKNVSFLNEKRAQDEALAKALLDSERDAENLRKAKLIEEYNEFQEFLEFRERKKSQADKAQKELVERLDRLRQGLGEVETYKREEAEGHFNEIHRNQ